MGNWAIDGGCSTLVADATTAPDGSNNASRIIYSCGGARKTQSITVSTITPLTFSIFLKPSSSNNGSRLLVYNNTTTTSLGSINIPSLLSGGTAYANGWRRYSLTVSSGWISGNSLRFYVYTDSSGGAIVGNDLYVWGAQVEAGSFPTSYIPTTTAAVTRAADNLTVPTTGGWFTTSSGSFSGQFQEASAQNTGGTSRVMGSSLLGRFVYRVSGDNTYKIYDGTNIVSTASMPINSNVKISSSYGSNGLAISANGAAPVTGSFDGTWGDQGFIWVGANYTGYISKYNFYPSQLSNTQLQLLTQ